LKFLKKMFWQKKFLKISSSSIKILKIDRLVVFEILLRERDFLLRDGLQC